MLYMACMAFHHHVCWWWPAARALNPRQSSSRGSAICWVEQCVAEVKTGMDSHFLKMNSSKTELFIITTPQVLRSLLPIQLEICGENVTPRTTCATSEWPGTLCWALRRMSITFARSLMSTSITSTGSGNTLTLQRLQHWSMGWWCREGNAPYGVHRACTIGWCREGIATITPW